jgi:hypothetical protein
MGVLYIIEATRANSASVHEMLSFVNPGIIAGAPSRASLGLVADHANDPTARIGRYTVYRALSAPHGSQYPKSEAPTDLTTAQQRFYSAYDVVGTFPTPNEDPDVARARVAQWYEVDFMAHYNATPGLDAVIIVDTPVLDYLHEHITGGGWSTILLQPKGDHGKVTAYDNDGVSVTFVKQIQ